MNPCQSKGRPAIILMCKCLCDFIQEGHVFQIIYHSSAVWRPSDISNIEILRAAKTRNTALGITGLLVRDDMRFIQVLEGPRDALARVFDLICKDPRHHSIQLLHFEQTDRARFADWAMEYSDSASRPAPGQTADVQAYQEFFDHVSAQIRTAA